MATYLVTLSLLTLAGFALAIDYCLKDLCGDGITHIACGHSGKFSSSCSSDAAMVNISADIKNLIINEHNQHRNFIAGGSDANHGSACQMATMQWDDELASLAALNVMQCKMNHDSCHNTAAFKYSGQNLAWVGYFGQPNNAGLLVQTISMWYNEVKNSNRDFIASYPNNFQGPTIGHFTVMMADRNTRLGCAASTYSVKGVAYKYFLVSCNYATTNMIDFPIYAACDVPASNCTTGKNPKYSNLCSTSEVYDINKW